MNSLYYSSSILNAYLGDNDGSSPSTPVGMLREDGTVETTARLSMRRDVEGSVVGEIVEGRKNREEEIRRLIGEWRAESANSEKSEGLELEGKVTKVPRLSEIDVQSPEMERRSGPKKERKTPTSTKVVRLDIRNHSEDDKRNTARTSFVSKRDSLHSSITIDSDDVDLESVQLPFEQLDLENRKTSRFQRVKQFLTGEQPEKRVLDDNAKFSAYVEHQLKTNFYFYDDQESAPVLDIKFAEGAEVFFFGETLTNLFPSDQAKIHYLMLSSFELGEQRFSNLNRFHTDAKYDVPLLLADLKPQLEVFGEILDMYALSDANISRGELFERFSQFANDAAGLCIPLAISMFGNWLLSFSRDSAVDSNYQNDLILDYFRKLVRLALVVRRLEPLFEQCLRQLPKQDRWAVNCYWKKDNINALATSLHSLGEYYQYLHEHDKAVTMWEINCHLTEDSELGHLAIMGLGNGYGFGNHLKRQSPFGHRSKKHRFVTKRRIAHMYRIMMKKPDFDEFGVSWATKDKYD